MLKNPQNQDESAKAYAKSQITGELSLKELSRRVAAQTTASRADVTAVIIATVENMIDGLRAGVGGEHFLLPQGRHHHHDRCRV